MKNVNKRGNRQIQRITKLSRIHPLGIRNICTNFPIKNWKNAGKITTASHTRTQIKPPQTNRLVVAAVVAVFAPWLLRPHMQIFFKI